MTKKKSSVNKFGGSKRGSIRLVCSLIKMEWSAEISIMIEAGTYMMCWTALRNYAMEK